MTMQGDGGQGRGWGNGRLSTHGRWEDARAAARAANANARAASVGGEATPHGLTPAAVEAMRDRFETFLPGMASKHGAAGSRARDFFDQLLPPGANLDPGAGRGMASAMARSAALRRQGAGSIGMGANMPYGAAMGNGVMVTNQRPYQPEFESPDRQNYPVHRNLANIYWRLFYKLDPVVGTGIDLLAEMPWSNFELSGEGVEGEVKVALEGMLEETQLRTFLPYLVREFFVIGECAPHLFFDDDKGIWTHIALHNPDQLEVIHSPFLKMEPLVEFKPEDRLRQILTSNNPMLKNVRESVPEEILAALVSGQNIPLSPVNCTFIPRKLHPYDIRGTSILSRMWRVFMYEDSLFNASLAIARRAAAPLKIAKLGDQNTGWIPDPSQEKRLLELLTQAEIDPAAWLVYHYGITFELVGSQERAWKVEQTSEFIERMKLMALGISKAFLWGEVTYASAASGLTVFLQRLKSLREFFESVWLYPKFFRPVAEMNKWIKPTQAELDHRVRTKRSKRELDEANRYIIPKIEWDKPLDPSIDSAMISAIGNLAQLGVTFSKTTLASLVNRDYEKELEQRIRETKIEQDMLAKHPELAQAMQQGQGEGGGGGGPGAVSPGLGPPPDMGGGEGGGDTGGPPPPPGGEGGGGEGGPPPAAKGDEGAAAGGHGGTPSRVEWDAEGRYGAWGKDEALDLINVLREGDDPEEDPWRAMLEEWKTKAKARDPYALAAMRALKAGDIDDVWEAAQEWMLIDGGYPPRTIRELEAILKGEGLLTTAKPDPREVAARTAQRVLATSGREAEILRQLDGGDDGRLFVGAPQERRSAGFSVHAGHGRRRIP